MADVLQLEHTLLIWLQWLQFIGKAYSMKVDILFKEFDSIAIFSARENSHNPVAVVGESGE
jgi:hypothetical protein